MEGKQGRHLKREAGTSHWPSEPLEMPTVSLICESGRFFRDFSVFRRPCDNERELTQMTVSLYVCTLCLLQMAFSSLGQDVLNINYGAMQVRRLIF